MMGRQQGAGQKKEKSQGGREFFDLATEEKHNSINPYSTCFLFVNFLDSTPIDAASLLRNSVGLKNYD